MDALRAAGGVVVARESSFQVHVIGEGIEGIFDFRFLIFDLRLRAVNRKSKIKNLKSYRASGCGRPGTPAARRRGRSSRSGVGTSGRRTQRWASVSDSSEQVLSVPAPLGGGRRRVSFHLPRPACQTVQTRERLWHLPCFSKTHPKNNQAAARRARAAAFARAY
jgi:hypothetical protein